MKTEHKAIILFDGVCNFCNSSVNFIIKRDKKDFFLFSSLQSEYSQNLLKQNNFPQKDFDSIILIEKKKLYQKSTAALMIAKHLTGFWKVFYVFIIIPPFIRDFFYGIIAKYRYKWFGRKDACMIPDERVRKKFI